ncbi:WXG100 family type VII secretion target [Streptomyces sp. MST-110588]|uniref:WXG100 family type VII secretion target n=1 Tax=Streptomyces sp. MST-110588 TaxID=2833628 RepID=UPI001F5D39B7|nr:WXG100 family type VII secretion target [Streptomyces sp. MST-110588]UNO39639.1 WXG100 family type VII secretion target [Streptomyces sp. MST-110588]
MTERRDPGVLHDAAAGWRDMGKHLDGLVRDLDRQVARAAAENWQGPAGEAFAADWHRLKRTVDESLPAFELAAADLESAAAHPADSKGGGDAPAEDSSDGGSRSSGSGSQTAYGFMALGQMATSLGGMFGGRGKGGKGGGQGQRPALHGEWATSSAPSGPDPFGPPGTGSSARRGGEGVAKGVRTGVSAAGGPASVTGSGVGTRTGSRTDAATAAGAKDTTGTQVGSGAKGGSGEAKPADAGTGTGPGAGAEKSGKEKGTSAAPAAAPRTDVQRHGAFG